MDLSIIIVSFNTKKLTIECIDSVIKYTKGIEFEIVVIDNASVDGSPKEIKKIYKSKKLIKLIENRQNVGFGRANNQGIKKSRGRYILFLNSDTYISDNVLGEMVKWMDKNKEVGIASCALKNPDSSLQGTGGYFPTLLRVFTWMTIQDLPFVDSIVKPFHPMKEKSFVKGNAFYKKRRELDWVTGAFLLIRKEAINAVGGFDEDYFMYTEETDLCYRVKKKGWKVMYNPKWSIIHYGGASGTNEKAIIMEFKGIKIFYEKHYEKWKQYILKYILKLGIVIRIIAFIFIGDKSLSKTYLKALNTI